MTCPKCGDNDLYEHFKKYEVLDCIDLKSFMEKYYKHDRYQGRGEEYTYNLFMSHRDYLLNHGFDFISRHDSITGRVVSFYPKPENKQ